MRHAAPARLRTTTLLVLALSAATGTAQAGRKDVILSAWDQVARTGTVVLTAKLEREGFGEAAERALRAPAYAPLLSPDALVAARLVGGDDLHDRRFWRRDLPGKTLEFRRGGELLGSAVTDDDGTATVTWDAGELGDHAVEVRFAGDADYAPGADTLLCSVRSPDRDLVILDIDHTLSHTSNWNVIKGKIDDLPLEHSPAVVPKILATHDVVYVTARPNKFLDVTKRWLAHWGFPRLPVYLLDWKKYPTYDEAKYKTQTLARIKESFPRMVLGIGDKKTDAIAYRNHGLRTLILGETGGVQGAERVADWHEIDGILFGTRVTLFRRMAFGADAPRF